MSLLLGVQVITCLLALNKPTPNNISNLVAEVIYAESASTSIEERRLVASCIKNRINHKGFNKGNLKSMLEVVKVPNQFSCINDPNNKQFKLKDSKKDKKIWNECLKLSTGKFIVEKDIVCYHDNSITKPKSWVNNKYWNYVLVKSTKHFKFYKVVERN